mgnify:FL=1
MRRAATTGSGGNVVNAHRQNIRRVLETPKLRAGFSKEELKAMREIADGKPTQNALRLLGKLSPTSGGLTLGGFSASAAASGAAGNPLFMAPSALGLGAKRLSDRSTKKQVQGLAQLIRNGGPLPRNSVSDTERRMIAALMANQVAQTTPMDSKITMMISGN